MTLEEETRDHDRTRDDDRKRRRKKDGDGRLQLRRHRERERVGNDFERSDAIGERIDDARRPVGNSLVRANREHAVETRHRIHVVADAARKRRRVGVHVFSGCWSVRTRVCDSIGEVCARAAGGKRENARDRECYSRRVESVFGDGV